MFVAAKLPQRLGPGGWAAMLPPRRETAPLQGAVTADVAVVGAGFAGLAAARRLRQHNPNVRVAILEALAIGEGACGRNSGFLIDLPHEVSSRSYGGESAAKSQRDIAINRAAIALAREVAAEQGLGPEVFNPCGKYSLATSRKGDQHLAAYSRQLADLREAHRRLDKAEAQALTGSPAYSSGLFTPGAVIIQPAAYVRAFADSLVEPVALYERTPALSLERRSEGWRIRTPGGTLDAGAVVLANNGHARSFGLFAGRLLDVFTYASLTEPFDPARLGGKREWAATPALAMGTSVRRVRGEDGDRILVRSRYSHNVSLEVGQPEIDGAGKLHDVKFAARFPMLKGVRMEHRWAGAMAMTWNAVPAFGEIESGLYAACACNGVGGTKATALGIAAADLALGADTEMTRMFLTMAAPRALPPQPLATLGAKATLAFREWRARAE